MILEEEFSAVILEAELDTAMILEEEYFGLVMQPEDSDGTILLPIQKVDYFAAIELYNEGKSFREIAKILNSNHKIIARILRKHGLATNKNVDKDTSMFVLNSYDVLKLYNDGYTCHAISKILNVKHVRTIKKRLELAGVVFDKPFNAPKQLDEQKIRQLYESNMNYSDIAKQLGTTGMTIKSRLKKMGLVQ